MSYKIVVDSLLLCLVVDGWFDGSTYGSWPIDPIEVMDAWRRRLSEALLDVLLIFTELRFEELSSFSRKLERTAISIKSLSLRSKGLLFYIGPPSGAGLSSGNLSVIYLDLQYLLILNSVSAIIEVLSWPILTYRND